MFSHYPTVFNNHYNELCNYYMSQMYKSIIALLYIIVNIHFQKLIPRIKYNR